MSFESLEAKLVFRIAFAFIVVLAALFLAAGTARYWQGWMFLAVMFGSSILMGLHFYSHDRRLLERRLETKEKQPEQRIFRRLAIPLWILGLVLPGLDHRFGWSNRTIGRVPVGLTLLAQALIISAYLLLFRVLKTNSFASSVIQVESGQAVISSGPYRLVRHPMYSAILVLVAATPLALGSWMALPVFALMVPLLVFRAVHEEKLLLECLPGYSEYCQRTRFRLLPFVL